MGNFSNKLWKLILDETWERISQLTKDLETFKKYLEEERYIAEKEENSQKIDLLLSIIDLNKKLIDKYFENIKIISAKLVFS